MSLSDEGPTTMSDQPSVKQEEDIKHEPSPDPSICPPSPAKSKATSSKSAKKEKSPSTPVLKTNGSFTTGPQLISDLPRAEEEAFKTFVNLENNVYQYQTLGRVKAIEESYLCDCVYEHGVSDLSDACGEGSECINRLTQVECEEGECRCRSYCQNQRFQRKQSAEIQVVLTEKKGYGIRAGTDIDKDEFVYEYIGEVVSHPSFMKRMREYAEEGLRHFYFMMLQKDEYIDATKKGGIGRFVNHSCNPNAYVAKWTVGKRLRMGIFAKRKILKDEELTFNYNVDRYGHDAQPCYCGEPNCVGYLGGKTQTDLSTMDDLYLDALGIADEVEMLNLKGSKKKKAKKLDEDFVPIMKPILPKEVPKVIQAMKQTTNKRVMAKLLTRIKITEDPAVLRSVMRLRAFSVMRALFQEYTNDLEIMCLGMECMLAWPLQNRNKVDDSKIEDEIAPIVEHDNESVKNLAKRLIDHWATFSSAYRIPKRLTDLDMDCDMKPIVETPRTPSENVTSARRKAFTDPEFTGPKPLGTMSVAPVSTSTPVPQTPAVPAPTNNKDKKEKETLGIEEVIAAATKAAEEKRQKEEEEKAAAEEKEAKRKKRKEEKEAQRLKKESDPQGHAAEKNANKEKRLQKLVGEVVVKAMSKYSKQLGHDVFKKHAKEITTSICEKEKKSSTYEKNRLDSLPEDKQTKVKKFTKVYVHKLLKKMHDKKASSSSSHRHAKPASQSQTAKMTSPGSDRTPPGDAGSGDPLQGDADMNDVDMEVEVDMDAMSEDEAVGDVDIGGGGEGEGEVSPPGPSTGASTLVGEWDTNLDKIPVVS